jgi:hypothetical protein
MAQSSCNAGCFRLTGSPKTSSLSLRHKRRCSAAKPEDIGLGGGDSIQPFDVAAVSRGFSRPHRFRQKEHLRAFALLPSRPAVVEFAPLRLNLVAGILPDDEPADTTR